MIRIITVIIAAIIAVSAAAVHADGLPEKYRLPVTLTMKNQGVDGRCGAYAFSTALEACTGRNVAAQKLWAYAMKYKTNDKPGVWINHLIPAAHDMLKITVTAEQLTDVQSIKEALFAGKPVVMNMPWYVGYNKYTRGNMGASGAYINNHAVTVIGYNAEALLIQNSGGTDWGNRGLGWLPYDAEWDCAYAISITD